MHTWVVSTAGRNLRLRGDRKGSEGSGNGSMFWRGSRGGAGSGVGHEWGKLADREAIA